MLLVSGCLGFAGSASLADLLSFVFVGAGLSAARIVCACVGVGFEGRFGAEVENDESENAGAAGRDGNEVEESKRSLCGEAVRGVGFCGRAGRESRDERDDSDASETGVPSRDSDELPCRVKRDDEL